MVQWVATLLGAGLGSLTMLILAGFGFSSIKGGIMRTLKDHSDKLAQLHNGLYRDDGTLVYVPKMDCISSQQVCTEQQQRNQVLTCQKLEILRKDLVVIGGKRETEAKDFQETLNAIQISIAKIESMRAPHIVGEPGVVNKEK